MVDRDDITLARGQILHSLNHNLYPRHFQCAIRAPADEPLKSPFRSFADIFEQGRQQGQNEQKGKKYLPQPQRAYQGKIFFHL